MAGLADFLLTAAPAAATYDPMLTPEANALAGAKPPAPVMQPPATFQRPKGLRGAVGTVFDILAAMGGQETGTDLARQEFADQQKIELARQKENAFADYLTNPNDPAKLDAFKRIAPVEAFKVITDPAMNPRAASTGSLPREVVIAQMLADPNVSPEVKSRLEQLVASPVLRTGPGGAIVDVTNPNNPNVVMPGRDPAPPAPRTQVVTVGDRQLLVDLNTGNPIRDLGPAAPKGARTASTGGMNPQADGKAKARMASIPAILQTLDTLETMKPGLSGPVAGMIPGNLNADANSFDKVLGQLTQQIRGLTKIEGEGSISDLETRLMGLQLPSRTDTPRGRATAIRQLRALAKQTEASYRQMLGGGQPTPAAPAGGGFKVVGKRKPQ